MSSNSDLERTQPRAKVEFYLWSRFFLSNGQNDFSSASLLLFKCTCDAHTRCGCAFADRTFLKLDSYRDFSSDLKTRFNIVLIYNINLTC